MKAINLAADALAEATGYRSWPLGRHVVVSSVLVLGLGLLAWSLISHQRIQLKSQQAELTQLEQTLKTLSTQAKPPAISEPDFTQRWPQRDEINAVVRFLGTLAQQHQVNLVQMALSHTASSAQATGRVDISINMNSGYASGKLVLSELMSRYPSLALQSLTATPRSGDTAKIDWALALTLYVKD